MKLPADNYSLITADRPLYSGALLTTDNCSLITGSFQLSAFSVSVCPLPLP